MYPRTTKALGRTAFALLIGMAVCLAAATFVEKTEGSEFAARHIYRTGWFAAWWALIAASALPVAVVRIGPGKRAAVACSGARAHREVRAAVTAIVQAEAGTRARVFTARAGT